MRMKILLTGANNLQRGRGKPKFAGQNHMAKILYQMLSEFADVDWIPVDSSTDFKKYDVVISGIGAFGSLAYHYSPSAVYAIEKAKNPVVYIEDWKCMKEITNKYRALYERGYDWLSGHELAKLVSAGPDKKTGKPVITKLYSDLDKIDIHDVYAGLVKICGNPKTLRWLIPGFDWGDKDVVGTFVGGAPGTCMHFDVSPILIEQYGIEDVDYDPNRKARYLCVAKCNHDPWLKRNGILEQTDRFGWNPYPKIGSEREVNAKCREYLGLTAPAYYYAGSGWWRLRYVLGAASKNVFFLDEPDAKALGIECVKDLSSDPDYVKKVALDTAKQIQSYIPTYEQACASLEKQLLATL